MSKIDEKYISALESFTEALAEIVETLKEQQKTGKADTVNEMLKNSSEGLGKVVKDLKKVTQEGFRDVKNQNSIIERKIDGIKKQKESGMFDRIEDPKNKNKIVDGIKVVVLIAAGVLALGMAFKIIGKVDFISVMAISGAMVAMAVAYTKIADTKGLSFGKIFRVAMILPIMALGLAASGYLLRNFPKIGLMQGISIMVVAGALGLATYLISKALGKLSVKSLIMIPLIPIILPLIALGIVKASYILKDVKQLTLMQVFSVALVGLALGVATFGIGLALKGMKNISWKEMLALPIMIPLIAGGIVLASSIFQAFVPIKNPLQLLLGSLVMGVSILMFTPVVYMLGKLNFSQIVKGSIGILAVAGAILGVAWIFSLLPVEMRYPGFMWSLGTGLSILAFGLLSVALGLLTSVVTPIVFGIGLLALLAVAGAILGVAWIFSLLPVEMRYPGFMWSLGTGLSILAFGLLSVALGLLTSVVTPIVFGIGLLALLAVAGSMVGVSLILNQGKWDGPYPSIGWALGVGGSLLIFGLAAVAASVGGVVSAVASLFTGEDPLVKLAKSMSDISWILQGGKWDAGYPSLGWAQGVGTALLLFSSATVLASVGGLATAIIGFFSGDKDPLKTLAQSMVDVSWILQGGKWDGNKYPSLTWAAGVGAALTVFAAVTVLASAQGLVKSVLGVFSGDKDPLQTLANSMVKISWLLQKGKWGGNYPTVLWSAGVGASLTMFAGLTTLVSGSGLLNKIFDKLAGAKEDPLIKLATNIVDVATLLNSVDWNGVKYPSSNYISNFSYLMMEMNKLIPMIDLSSIILVKGFVRFSTNSAMALATTSLLLNAGNYDKTPSYSYINMFSYFVLMMASIVDRADFDVSDSMDFLKSSLSLGPAMSIWNRAISDGDYSKTPSIDYTNQLAYFISTMGLSVKIWLPSVEDSLNFKISTSYVVPGINELLSLPIISPTFLMSMFLMRESLKQISFGVDEFLYEKRLGGIIKVRRSLEDFSDFNKGLTLFVSGLNALAGLKPIPSGFMSSFNTFLEFLNKMPEKSLFFSDKYDNIKEMAKSINMLAESFSNLNKGMLSFLDMSKGLFLISVIDDVKLGKVLQSVQKHQQALKIVNQVPEEQSNLLDVIKNLYSTIPAIIGGQAKEEGPKFEGKDSEKKQKDKFYNDIAEIKSALYQLLDNFDKPTQAGSFHK